MAGTETLTNYNANAAYFDKKRKPSPIVVNILREAFLPSCGRILSVGCGTGQYEAALRGGKDIVGLDRSVGMLSIAMRRLRYCVLGDMGHLPFAEGSFGGVYFVQSLHHLGANLEISSKSRDDARKGALREATRVLRTGSLIIVQRDPSQNQAVWFWKYFPRALETKLVIQPRISTIVEWLTSLGLTSIRTIPVNDPMIRGFYDPVSPLSPEFRHSFSEFSYLTEKETLQGIEDLRAAIRDGTARRDIEICQRKFQEIGGTVFVVSARKN